MAQIKTFTSVSTTEHAIALDAFYPYVWIENQGENDCYVGNYSGFSAQETDVVLIKAGTAKRVDAVKDTVYAKTASGTTTLEVHGQPDATLPFKVDAKGGGGFTRTVLYDSGGYDQYAPFQTDVPLLDNLSNYDFIVVSIGTDDDNARLGKYECDSAVYDVQLILRNDYNAHYAAYYQRWCDIRFTDTTFNIMNSNAPSESTSLKPCVYFIVGYKFGA